MLCDRETQGRSQASRQVKSSRRDDQGLGLAASRTRTCNRHVRNVVVARVSWAAFITYGTSLCQVSVATAIYATTTQPVMLWVMRGVGPIGDPAPTAGLDAHVILQTGSTCRNQVPPRLPSRASVELHHPAIKAALTQKGQLSKRLIRVSMLARLSNRILCVAYICVIATKINCVCGDFSRGSVA